MDLRERGGEMEEEKGDRHNADKEEGTVGAGPGEG